MKLSKIATLVAWLPIACNSWAGEDLFTQADAAAQAGDFSRMQQTYEQYIQSLRDQRDRLRTGAENASDEAKAKLSAQADELSGKINAAYEEVQSNYQEMLSRSIHPLGRRQRASYLSRRPSLD